VSASITLRDSLVRRPNMIDIARGKNASVDSSGNLRRTKPSTSSAAPSATSGSTVPKRFEEANHES
jgi:hypothetical protein